MVNTALNQRSTDELNLRLSIALNTGAPFCFLGIAISDVPYGISVAIICGSFGLTLYSFVEYCVHRWILHEISVVGHRHHHLAPHEPHALLFSTGVTVHTLMLVALSLLVNMPVAIWTVSGSAFGYALFCQLHDFEHRDPGLSARLWPNLHRHHMLHHDGNSNVEKAACPGYNYGVLTTFWDRLFRTFRP